MKRSDVWLLAACVFLAAENNSATTGEWVLNTIPLVIALWLYVAGRLEERRKGGSNNDAH